MKSLRSLAGVPVILRSTGARAGRLNGVVTDFELQRLDGIWVSGRLGGTKYLAGEDIDMVGEYSVLANKLGARKPAGERFKMRRALDLSGAIVGAVVGAYIDPDSLNIVAVELTRGFWEDIAQGRQIIRHYAVRPPDGDVHIFDEGEDEHE